MSAKCRMKLTSGAELHGLHAGIACDLTTGWDLNSDIEAEAAVSNQEMRSRCSSSRVQRMHCHRISFGPLSDTVRDTGQPQHQRISMQGCQTRMAGLLFYTHSSTEKEQLLGTMRHADHASAGSGSKTLRGGLPLRINCRSMRVESVVIM